MMNGFDSFSKDAALRYGLAEALILNCLTNLVRVGTKDYDVRISNDKIFLKLSYSQLQCVLPYLSVFKLRTGLEALKAAKLIEIEDFEIETLVKRRRWHYYTVTPKGYEFASEGNI